MSSGPRNSPPKLVHMPALPNTARRTAPCCHERRHREQLVKPTSRDFKAPALTAPSADVRINPSVTAARLHLMARVDQAPADTHVPHRAPGSPRRGQRTPRTHARPLEITANLCNLFMFLQEASCLVLSTSWEPDTGLSGHYRLAGTLGRSDQSQASWRPMTRTHGSWLNANVTLSAHDPRGYTLTILGHR